MTLFAGVAFVRAGAEAAYHDADDVYLGPPFMDSGLSRIYDGSIEGRSGGWLMGGVQAASAQGPTSVFRGMRRGGGTHRSASTIPTHPALV